MEFQSSFGLLPFHLLSSVYTKIFTLSSIAFMQNWERNTFTICRFGKIFGSTDDHVRNYIDCTDVAEVAANKLLSNNALNGEAITLTGPEAISNSEMAERLSYVAGHKIEYVNISRTELLKLLIKRAKLPEWLATHIVELDEFTRNVPEPRESTIEKILNRKPCIMNAYLQEARHLFTKKSLLSLI